MTREERINNLPISDEEKEAFHNVYQEYDERKDQEDWKLEFLLPKSQALLEARYTNRVEVKCLFVLVGTSLEPLLLSILTVRPTEKLALIFSVESEFVKNKILATLNQNFASGNIIPKEKLTDEARHFIDNINSLKIVESKIDKTTPETVFATIKSLVDNFNPTEIGVDITGGKKSMVGGGFLASAINRFQLFYVDFDEYDGTEPLQGSEFIHLLENPYDLYNVDLINQAKELFKNHNYPAAVCIFKQVVERLAKNAELFSLQKELEAVKRMHTTAKFYAKWDAFEYGEAYNIQNLDILEELKKLEDINKGKSEKEWIKIYEVHNQFEYVKKIALDRFANAKRREAQGRYEDAITRYAQAVEIACKSKFIQTLINNKGYKPTLTEEKEVDGKKITEEKALPENIHDWQADYASVAGIINWLLCIQKIKWKVEKLGTFQLEKYTNKNLKDAFCSKFNLGSEISGNKLKEKSKEITDVIEIRNNFIHVSTLAAKKEKMEKLKDFACKMLEVIYGTLDFTPYTFSTEFNDDGTMKQR